MISYLFGNLGPWTWITLGVILMGLELLVPGVFMIWLGLAAMCTGMLALLFGLAWQPAMLVFVVLAVGFAFLGRWLSRPPLEEEARASELPHLSRRGEALVGRVLQLETPIARGEGRVRVDDSSWRVSGPDLPAGTAVKVLRVDGATLVVEAAPGRP